MRRYRVTYVHRNWAREPRSPFAAHTVDYSDPSAAHEAALKLKAQGHLRVQITPFNAADEEELGR